MKFLKKFQKVKAFVFDIDGVMSDGRLLAYGSDFIRQFNLKDGYAIRKALDAGYELAVISGAHSAGIEKRLEHLGFKNYYLGISDKLPVFLELLEKLGLKAENVLYMGDDIPDIPVLKASGISCCPNDAVPEVISCTDYISPKTGGNECVRDVIEKVMRLQDKWINS